MIYIQQIHRIINIFALKSIIRTIFCLFCFFSFNVIYSQNYRFIYEVHYKNDSTLQDYEKVNMVLDITKKMVKFYDLSFLEYDSINKNTNSNLQTNSQIDQLLIRKPNEAVNNSYKSLNFDYFVIPSQDELRWNIENDTKYIAEFKLQKATCNFGGRHWIAWFCDAIPLYEGPYKFNGLPGLIFQIEDEKKNFIYSLVKNYIIKDEYLTEDFLETHYGNKPIKVTQGQYNKILLDYYNDPVAELRNSLKKGGVVKINNTLIQSLSQLDTQKKNVQNSIRKNYNPIELDKSVKYK